MANNEKMVSASRPVKPVGVCPFEDTADSTRGVTATSELAASDDQTIREHMLNWYRFSGFRGCVFNKVAAKDTQDGEFAWETPIERRSVDELVAAKAMPAVAQGFSTVIAEGKKPGLVSYLFPGIQQPRDLGRLLKYLVAADPGTFRILNIVNRERVKEFGNMEFVGIQFRIKVGKTALGDDALAYPMIYNPWDFTTFARRYDIPMIVFNRYNAKQNPETPDTFIGVDDVDLRLTQATFDRMYARSLEVNGRAHTYDGQDSGAIAYSRTLFRAHNALVLPSQDWDEVVSLS